MSKHGTGAIWPGDQPGGWYGNKNTKCGKCCTNTGTTNPSSQNRWKFCNMIQYSNSHEHLLKQNSYYNEYLHWLKYNNACTDHCTANEKKKNFNLYWKRLVNNPKNDNSYENYLKQAKMSKISHNAAMPFQGLMEYNN